MSLTLHKNLADIVLLTRTEFEKNKYDSVGLAQTYPTYEVINQYVRARRMVEDSAYEIESDLEIATTNLSERTGVAHPLEVNAPKQNITIKSRLVPFRTPMTWSAFEKAFQGKSETKLIDIVQQRFTKLDRDHWETMENDLVSTDYETASEDKFRSLRYWITDDSAQTGNFYSQNAGDDPIASGKAGITIAAQPKFTNAVAGFENVSQEDYFDKISKFLNSVKMDALVPHPQVAPEAPMRVNYVQDPVKRAAERLLGSLNQNHGRDVGFYREACYYRDIPITILQSISSPQSPVRPTTGVALLVDWNSFIIQVHSEFNRRNENGQVANTPLQFWEALFTMYQMHCSRPDRNMYMKTAATDLQPDAVS